MEATLPPTSTQTPTEPAPAATPRQGDTAGRTPPPNPFVGPEPFVEGQVLHGRSRETRALTDLLIAKRVVLLIAPSGAGKTSLIQAALIPGLRGRLDPLPLVRLGGNGAAGPGNRYLRATLARLGSDPPEARRVAPEQLAQPPTLADYLSGLASRDRGPARHRLLVLDQFEELFTLDRFDWAEKESFLGQLGQALGGGLGGGEDEKETPPLWALLSMREDYVAELEPYLHLIPTGLAFRYRLAPLEREQAIEAITRAGTGAPKATDGSDRESTRAGRAVTPTANPWILRDAADKIVDDLLMRSDSADAAKRPLVARFVEPVQLQVVCLRLWDKVVAAQGRPLEAADLGQDAQAGTDSNGEVDAALADYYDSLMTQAAAAAGVRERRMRGWVESNLISRTRMRTRLLREPSPFDPGIDLLLVRHLLRGDTSGDRDWLELAHDRLVSPILRSNEVWRERNLALFQRQAKLWSEHNRPDDMLFLDEHLTEALRYAEANPQSVSAEVDRPFLDRCKVKAAEKAAEQRHAREIEEQAREIALKNDQIRAKNRRLRTRSRWLAAFVVLAMVALGFSLKALMWISDQNVLLNRGALFGRVKRAAAVARSGSKPVGLAQLLAAAQEQQDKGIELPHRALDLALIETLGGHPPAERRVGGHDHLVRALRFSADGDRLYSAGWDDRLRAWSVADAGPWTGQPLESHEDYRSDIRSLAERADLGLLVSTDDDGEILVWKNRDGRLVPQATLNLKGEAHQGPIWSAALSPVAPRLATGGRDGRIQVWDLADPTHPRLLGRIRNRFHKNGIYRLAYVPAGPLAGALVAGDWGGRVSLWRDPEPSADGPREPDLDTRLTDTVDRDVAVMSLAPDPTGRWVALGDNQGDVFLWTLGPEAGPGPLLRFPAHDAHRASVLDLDVSPDGDSLVSVGSDETLIRWSIPAGWTTREDFYEKLKSQRFEGWGEKLYSVAFRPGSNTRVAVGGGRTIWLSDLDHPNPLASALSLPPGSSPRWRSLAATRDLADLAALAPDDRRVYRWHWDGTSYRVQEPLEVPAGLSHLALGQGPAGLTLAALACPGQLYLWNLGEGPVPPPQVIQAQLPDLDSTSHCALAMSADGLTMATGVGNALGLWTRAKNSTDWRGAGQAALSGDLRALAFDPSGHWIASAGDDDGLRLWGLTGGRLSGERRCPQTQPRNSIQVLAFNPDGTTLIAGAEDALVTAWSVPELNLASSSRVHVRAVTAFASAGDAKDPILLSGDAEGQLVLCGGGVGDTICQQLGPAAGARVAGLAVDPDLNRLVMAEDGLWIWDLRPENLLATAKRLSR